MVRHWSIWGKSLTGGQTIGFDDGYYYIQSETGDRITVFRDEMDDLIFQLLRLKRKVEKDK